MGVTSTTHASGELGQVQGDAMRPLVGHIQVYHAGIQGATGIFRPTSENNPFWGHGDKDTMWAGAAFDNTYVTSTANENRPVNRAVRYLIRSLP